MTHAASLLIEGGATQLHSFYQQAGRTAMPQEHTLTVFNAVDVPDEIANKVMSLLHAFDPDCYTRACDENGRAL